MPYFVFRVQGEEPATRQLELLETCEGYRDAKTFARARRQEEPPTEALTFRIVFAESQELAEVLLRQPRNAPILKEWEK